MEIVREIIKTTSSIPHVILMTIVTVRFHGVLRSYQDCNCATNGLNTLVSAFWHAMSILDHSKAFKDKYHFIKTIDNSFLMS